MLYNHEKDLRAAEERIRRCISKPNQDLILDYESHCFADGLKIAGILKQLIELKIIAEMLGKDFSEASTKDITRLVERIERMDSSGRTKREYKSVVRRFYRWLGRGDLVDWIKIPSRKDARKLPEDLLSEEEIERMINACEHPRDKALVVCLYESGARVSELGNIKMKHVKFDQYGAVLMVDGKTGMRRVRITFSSPYLAT